MPRVGYFINKNLNYYLIYYYIHYNFKVEDMIEEVDIDGDGRIDFDGKFSNYFINIEYKIF